MSAITTMILSGVVSALVALAVSVFSMVVFLHDEKKEIVKRNKRMTDKVMELFHMAVRELCDMSNEATYDAYEMGRKHGEMASNRSDSDDSK